MLPSRVPSRGVLSHPVPWRSILCRELSSTPSAQAIRIVEESMQLTMERERADFGDPSKPQLVRAERMTKTLGYIYRLVEPEVWCL